MEFHHDEELKGRVVKGRFRSLVLLLRLGRLVDQAGELEIWLVCSEDYQRFEVCTIQMGTDNQMNILRRVHVPITDFEREDEEDYGSYNDSKGN